MGHLAYVMVIGWAGVAGWELSKWIRRTLILRRVGRPRKHRSIFTNDVQVFGRMYVENYCDPRPKTDEEKRGL